MKQGIRIEITDPCTQQWSDLTKNEKGRFCSSCSKTVIDFSRMSDNELIAYFKNYTGNVCGYFNDSQLNKVLLPQKYKSTFASKLIASWVGLFLSLNSKAQTIDSTKTKCPLELRPITPLKPSALELDITKPTEKQEIPVNRELSRRLGGVCVLPDNKEKNALKSRYYTSIVDWLLGQ
ncbi:MAG: hypothetical protein ACRCVT_02995 [Leadbetterella sp.]